MAAGDDDDATVDAEGSTADGLQAARPAVDRARMEMAKARSRAALFQVSEPGRIGRFVLLETIGAGAMGVVYAAYDPQLDRKVALKLLSAGGHQHPGARERMLGEARALAQLRHPNVVAVHDVVTVDAQIIIVMEFVEGQTLARWRTAAARDWPAIVERYAQAARGLAAAHRLGIVHRDFKPANVIVGDDGRVRVLDFGLARAELAPDAAPAELPAGLTQTGAIVGTPAYMAPEQLGGEAATAASDQWAFAVSLHEALFGTRPYVAETAPALAAEIAAGHAQRGDNKLGAPAWLRTVLERGFARDPAERHASMAALADELTRERGWRRYRWPALAAVAVTGAAVFALTRDDRAAAGPPACDGGAPELAEVWNPARAGALDARFAALATPYAAELARHVGDALDARAAAWSDVHRAACKAHRVGATSAPMYDRQVACLRRRLGDLRSAADVIAGSDPAALANAPDVVARMAPVAWCADLELLAADAEPPADPERRAAVEQVRAQLGEADALARAARTDEALAAAERATGAATPLLYPPLTIEASLLRGRLLLGRGELDRAIHPLAEAETLALAAGDARAAVEAAARRLFVEGQLGRDLAARAQEIVLVEAMSRHPRCAPFARPLLLNNLGVAAMARGKPDEAEALFTSARDARAGVAAPDLELDGILINLALVTRDAAARDALAAEAHARNAAALGANHPQSLMALELRSHLIVDPAAALALAGEACAAYARFHPSDRTAALRCARQLAELHQAVGQPDQATAHHRTMASFAAAPDPDDRIWARLGEAQLAATAGRDQRALDVAEAAIAEATRLQHWWLAEAEGELHLVASAAAERLARRAAAVEHARAAADLYRGLTERNRLAENRRGLDRATARVSALGASR